MRTGFNCLPITLLVLLFAVSASGCGAPTTTALTTTAPTSTSEIIKTQITLTPTPDEVSPTLEATAESRTVIELAEGLGGLPFDEFLEASYRRLLLRDPELVTELGLSDVFGTGNDKMTDISDAYIRETQKLEKAILELLKAYDRGALTPEEQLSYDIYAWYLDDLVRGHEFMYYSYPVTHFIIGQPAQLYHFFTEIHPVSDEQDAEDYIARLSQVDEKIEQLIEGLKLREEAGVIAPRFIYQWSMGSVRDTADALPEHTVFYRDFEESLSLLSSIRPARSEQLLETAKGEIESSVIPAFQALAAYLDDVQSRAPTDDGVWQHPNGEAYYEYVVRHHTTTEMTPDEIRDLGLRELERIHAEMRVIFDELGYPQDESLPRLYQRVAQDGGTMQGTQIVAEYEALIEAAKTIIEPAFDVQPTADVIVVGGPTGGYYNQPAVDGSRPGAFYAAVSGVEEYFGMPTLAYHEAVPGHHTQIALALELDLPSFRQGSHFTAYVEGWALYAERLMWELGVYDGDPYGNLGRLQYEAFRAARLVVDTGIHAKGWTFEEAVDFMTENTGLKRGMVNFEVGRYIAWPGQALAYKIGMDEILSLRQRAEEQLGEQFDLKEFHNVVLGHGALPLEILEQVVQEYIDSYQ